MLRSVKYFLRLEATSGLLLLAMATLALLMSNSGWLSHYEAFLAWHPQIALGDLSISFSLSHGINDGLMVIFFLMVGLEIKREMVEGELATRRTALLPVVAAFGGVAAPAIIFLWFNAGTPEMRGWAIPTATDIAFSLAVLTLFGDRFSVSLKIFLMALAVIDDLIAVLIIATFYTHQIDAAALIAALVLTGILWGFNRLGIRRAWPYVTVGFLLWLAVLASGVHATIAGVVLGALVPMRPRKEHASPSPAPEKNYFERVTAFGTRLRNTFIEMEAEKPSLGKSMIHAIHPWVAFLIMPLFAFANAGIPIGDLTPEHAFNPLALGIILGLFLGKPLGIVGAAWICQRLRLVQLPEGASWLEFLGVAALAGIGFTMSLFIGMLAFDSEPSRMLHMKFGILTGSLFSAVLGCLILGFAPRKSNKEYA